MKALLFSLLLLASTSFGEVAKDNTCYQYGKNPDLIKIIKILDKGYLLQGYNAMTGKPFTKIILVKKEPINKQLALPGVKVVPCPLP